MINKESLRSQFSKKISFVSYKESRVFQEYLRQAQWSFNLTIFLMVAGNILGALGVVLIFSGQISEGTATTAVGITSRLVTVKIIKLHQETNERLLKISKYFQQEKDMS